MTAKIKADLKAKSETDPLLGEDLLYRGGLRITSTLDLDLQQAFRRAVDEVLSDPANDPQAAIVAVDYRNGDIKAMATARRVPGPGQQQDRRGDPQGGHGLRAAVRLQPGDQRAAVGRLDDQAVHARAGADRGPEPVHHALRARRCMSIPNPGGTPEPLPRAATPTPARRGPTRCGGRMAHSVNTVYVPLANEVGRAKVADLAKKAGLSGAIKPGNLSFGIGAGVEVTPLSAGRRLRHLRQRRRARQPAQLHRGAHRGVGTDQGQVLEIVAEAPGRPGHEGVGGAGRREVHDRRGPARHGDRGPASRSRSSARPAPPTTRPTRGSPRASRASTSASPPGWATRTSPATSTTTHVVGTACGGMKGIHGVQPGLRRDPPGADLRAVAGAAARDQGDRARQAAPACSRQPARRRPRSPTPTASATATAGADHDPDSCARRRRPSPTPTPAARAVEHLHDARSRAPPTQRFRPSRDGRAPVVCSRDRTHLGQPR